MPIGVSGFNKDRLVQARNARGFTASTLADMLGVSPATISLYEKGTQKPRQEILDKLPRVLNLPTAFFLSDVPVSKPTRLFYRSMSSATKSARARAEARYEWALEFVHYLLGFFDFPMPNVPAVDLPEDFHQLDSLTIESAADQVREQWTLGDGPITNMIRTLESNGIIVWRTALEAETLDAFSEARNPHPFIVLASDKENYFRSRFDAAHELGHLILHRNVDQRTLNKAADFKLIETQAHNFAGAFLLPAVTYSKDLWAVSLDAFRALKPRWNVSIGMQIKRCRQLDLIDDQQEKRLWIGMSRRGWRVKEPLDDSTPSEKPTMVPKAIRMLIDERVRTGEQIAQDLNQFPVEVERLVELERGTVATAQETFPSLKNDKVIPFRR